VATFSDTYKELLSTGLLVQVRDYDFLGPLENC